MFKWFRTIFSLGAPDSSRLLQLVLVPLKFQFLHAPRHLQQRLVIYCYSLLEFFRCYLCRQIYHIISIQNINKNALTAAYMCRLLGDWIEK